MRSADRRRALGSGLSKILTVDEARIIVDADRIGRRVWAEVPPSRTAPAGHLSVLAPTSMTQMSPSSSYQVKNRELASAAK